MNEVFLALLPDSQMEDLPRQRTADGLCGCRWIYDAGKISDFLKGGWTVYKMNGLQKITEVIVELKMEKQNASEECSQSPKSDNECGR